MTNWYGLFAPTSPGIVIVSEAESTLLLITPGMLSVAETVTPGRESAGTDIFNVELLELPLIVTDPPSPGKSGLEVSIVNCTPTPACDTAILAEGFVPFLAVTVTVVLRASRPACAAALIVKAPFSLPDMGLTLHQLAFAILIVIY
ncbi:hypothetical protein M125_2842 [Bacteroides fragilis str. 3998T(B)3]|uniref:Uncharacterized protein n=1 Tax=Bacteroides fragilis str. 3998T(B)3 TaxID=1339316 RepID=A0A015X5J5_BACFG|nr:hypothetical protein M125_5531 [Bacteroides fragilis str. 3998T(B)3]EXY90457.1 hypothetical protein M125_2842 [Bacteroides fragilis str. 3998T(B)3]